MSLGCITELPCPCRKDIDGTEHCMKNEGDCEYQLLVENAAITQQGKMELLQEIKENICDNYCQYRDTADDEFLCDAIRDGEICPLDRLDELIN